MTDVLSTFNWPTNADMIADVAKLGYLDGTILDLTYGEGNFWTKFKPNDGRQRGPRLLYKNDLYKQVGFAYDYTNMPFGDNYFDNTVLDPDYKMTGTPSTPKMDFAYGTDRPMRYQDRLTNIEMGAREALRICSRYALIKCQDQIVSGNLCLQTLAVIRAVNQDPFDWFNFLQDPRPQPKGRRQVHARRNYSTLLVFKK